jgi:hypothetical protein
VSAIADVLAGVKAVLLLQDSVSRLEKSVEALSGDLRTLKDYAVSVELRVVRIEGMIDGVRAASAQRRLSSD